MAAMKRGTGGRSSFSGIVATVFGANGFVGRSVCNKLGKIGSQVIVPYRCDPYDVERMRMYGDLGQILFMPWHLQDEESIRKSLQYSNVVVNLVGRNMETKNWSYQEVNVEGPRRLARIAKEMGVEKFVHLSHLNAKEDVQTVYSTSKYMQTKYEGELAVREEFPEAIIFKSADVYGIDDKSLGAYKHFYRWAASRRSIALWKRGEQTIKHPVYVGDLAAGIVEAIKSPDMEGETIEAVGPDGYYLKDIVKYINDILYRDYMRITGFMLPLRLRAMIMERTIAHVFYPWVTPELLEREALTDWTDPSKLKLEDLGIEQEDFAIWCKAYFKPFRRGGYFPELLTEDRGTDPPLPADMYMPRSSDPKGKLTPDPLTG